MVLLVVMVVLAALVAPVATEVPVVLAVPAVLVVQKVVQVRRDRMVALESHVVDQEMWSYLARVSWLSLYEPVLPRLRRMPQASHHSKRPCTTSRSQSRRT